MNLVIGLQLTIAFTVLIGTMLYVRTQTKKMAVTKTLDILQMSDGIWLKEREIQEELRSSGLKLSPIQFYFMMSKLEVEGLVVSCQSYHNNAEAMARCYKLVENQ